MLFTVELKRMLGVFRLQNDGAWRNCTGAGDLKASDLTYATPDEVLAHSTTKGPLEIDGTLYGIDADQEGATEYGVDLEHEQLHHSSQVFRKDCPPEPTVEQLRDVIAKGDDSKNNCLILDVNGRFELRQLPFDQSLNDPSIVVRHSAFVGGNDYVGANASRDRKLLTDLFVSSLQHWKDHLKSHRTQAFSDEHATEPLEQIRSDLEEIRQNWKPDY